MLFPHAALYNLDAHKSNPVNMILGALGMIINNILYLGGVWVLFFAGKEQNAQIVPYFAGLTALTTTSWGALNFFFGGLRNLGTTISNGNLEVFMATPRNVLTLAGISQSDVVSLGDFLMGVACIILLGIYLSPDFALRVVIACIFSFLAFAGLFVFSSSLAFFLPRGGGVATLINSIIMFLSIYPTGKIFEGTGRLILLLTPVAATAILPMEAVENASLSSFGLAFLVSLAFFFASVIFFHFGMKRYQVVNVINLSK